MNAAIFLPDPDDAYEVPDWPDHDPEDLEAYRDQDDERAQALTIAERNPSM